MVENSGLFESRAVEAREGEYSEVEWEGPFPFLVSYEEEGGEETESFCDPHASLEAAEVAVSQRSD